MDPYHRKQFYWRLDVVLLFSLALLTVGSLQNWLFELAKQAPRWRPVAACFTAALLVALFGYHEYRIHWFRVNAVGQEYFLTKDAELLRPWLAEYERAHPQFSLATLSPELNYLCAYWTDADLILPSGFPYHSQESNLKIRERTSQLLQLYGVKPELWTSFAEPKQIFFHTHWRRSRPEAAGQSYIYHLYHRGFTLNSRSEVEWRIREIEAISLELEKLGCAAPAICPDVILIDQISRTLGQPELIGYRRAFKSGDLEAWVRETGSSVTIADARQLTTN
jgi:hypothetical protein